jgi:hypothetical protein
LSPRCGLLPHGGRRRHAIRPPKPCQEIPVEQLSGGVLARMRPDLSIGAALPSPGRNAGFGLVAWGLATEAPTWAEWQQYIEQQKDLMRQRGLQVPATAARTEPSAALVMHG